MWKVSSPEPEGDGGQRGLRRPWEPLTSIRQANYQDSSSSSSARQCTYNAEDLCGESDKENVFPMHSKTVDHNMNTYATFQDKRESVSLPKEFQPLTQHSSSSNVWDTNPKLPFEGSNISTIAGSDSYGLMGCAQSWEPVPPPFRPVLRDIGNLNDSPLHSAHQRINNNYIPSPSDFSSHLNPSISTTGYDSQCSQEPNYNHQSHKQHTGNL